MSVMLLKSDNVARCPKHILLPEHYSPDGSCQCTVPGTLTLRQKEEQAVRLHKCPVCRARPGFPCLHQNATRSICPLKCPHPERVQIVDPSLKGYKKYRGKGRDFRSRQMTGTELGKTDSRNKNFKGLHELCCGLRYR